MPAQLALNVKQMWQFIFQKPDWFRKVNAETVRADAYAGLTGATIVLPQGVAFAAIAGLPPEYGFYTAMVTPIVAALLGSSWHTVSGPTTAISALVFGALSGLYPVGSQEFLQAAVTLALFVGLIQMMLGLARLGTLVNYVSHSVMTGFIAGAALLIALSQVRHMLGLDLPRPEHIFQFLGALFSRLGETSMVSLLIALTALLTALLIKKYKPGWPNYLIALLIGTLVYLALGELAKDVSTIGEIGAVMPVFSLPPMQASYMQQLTSPALAIALVGLIEAMSVSRAIAMRSKQDIDANREFVGQGASNVVGSFFSCYPGSASFTRSGLNYEAGAKTPLSAIFAAVFLFLILLFVAPYFAYVPIPAMAGVIMIVAWKLIDRREIFHIVETSRSETAIAGITFAVSLLVDLEFSIYCGVILSVVLFMDRSSHPTLLIGSPDPSLPNRSFRSVKKNNLKHCPQLLVVGLDGPLFFGSVDSLRREFRKFELIYPTQTSMLFVVKGAGQIDLPAAELIIEEGIRRKERGGLLYIETKIDRTIKQFEKFHTTEHLGGNKIFLSKFEAISSAIEVMDLSICENCTARIFTDCPTFEKKKKLKNEQLEQLDEMDAEKR